MRKFTPGPWKAKQTRGNNRFEFTLFKMVGDFPGQLAVIEFASCEEAEANAHLIAAAPELLEACKDARKWFEDFIECKPRPDEQSAVNMQKALQDTIVGCYKP